jgi:hypothetical protein
MLSLSNAEEEEEEHEELADFCCFLLVSFGVNNDVLSFFESGLARFNVLVNMREVNEETVGLEDLSANEEETEEEVVPPSDDDGRSVREGRRSLSDGRLDKAIGVSERRVTDGVELSVDVVSETDGEGLLTFEIDGLEQLKNFRSLVGVAGIDANVGFAVKLVCLDAEGVPNAELTEEVFTEEENEFELALSALEKVDRLSTLGV